MCKQSLISLLHQTDFATPRENGTRIVGDKCLILSKTENF